MRIRVTDEDLGKEPPSGGNRKYKGPEYKILVWLPSGREPEWVQHRAGEWATEAGGVSRRQSTQCFVSHGEQPIFPFMPIQDSHTSQTER